MILGKVEKMGLGLSQPRWRSRRDDVSGCPERALEHLNEAVHAEGRLIRVSFNMSASLLTPLLNTVAADEEKATVLGMPFFFQIRLAERSPP